MVNISVAVENDFDIEFPDEQVEKFKDIEDMVKYVAKSFHAA
jgi:acyl carrier protein